MDSLEKHVEYFKTRLGPDICAVDWPKELKSSAVSYDGEEIFMAKQIHVRDVEPGLPPHDMAAVWTC